MVIVDDKPRRWHSAEMPRPESASFAAAVTPILPSMVRLAKRLADPAYADDIIQEALIRAWRHRRKFNPDRGTYRSWLFAIVANEARRPRRRLSRLSSNVKDLGIAPREDVLDLTAALPKLPKRQRLAIDCFYYAALTVDETAFVMGCSRGTVKSTLADARANLRRILEAG